MRLIDLALVTHDKLTAPPHRGAVFLQTLVLVCACLQRKHSVLMAHSVLVPRKALGEYVFGFNSCVLEIFLYVKDHVRRADYKKEVIALD